jgi:hypothetical protein
MFGPNRWQGQCKYWRALWNVDRDGFVGIRDLAWYSFVGFEWGLDCFGQVSNKGTKQWNEESKKLYRISTVTIAACR